MVDTYTSNTGRGLNLAIISGIPTPCFIESVDIMRETEEVSTVGSIKTKEVTIGEIGEANITVVNTAMVPPQGSHAVLVSDEYLYELKDYRTMIDNQTMNQKKISIMSDSITFSKR